MKRSADELAQTARLEDAYELAQSPVIQKITNQVCGCGYIGTSYATRAEADMVAKKLNLNPNMDLLDLGAGAGWPGLYLAKKSGCRVTLLDVPENGLRIARERSVADCTSGRVQIVNGDASNLPFGPGSFAAITHSDVLCCLLSKKRVLEECRRVISNTGRMAFSVIEVATGLSEVERARALDAGPEFVGCEQPYGEMLEETSWEIDARIDRTSELESAYQSLIHVEQKHETDLRSLRGDANYKEGQDVWAKKLMAVRNGFLRRFLYMAIPACRVSAC
jgi:ubiquinone/menaquinone biosynthesis C-methylase UbiE